MIMTYDFIFYARRDEKFMQQIRECIISRTDIELCTEIHRLHFYGKRQLVIVKPLSKTSKFHEKIIPKIIDYHTLTRMLDGHWDEIEYDRIKFDMDEFEKNEEIIMDKENKDTDVARQEIRAVYTDETIRVYQAYKKEIAQEAVRLGTFGSHFKMERMSWIKPSFLWMMYRCGWATKAGQERVLAIDIKRSAFDYIVNNAVVSSFQQSKGISYEEWQKQIKQSDIRCQWDPERDIWGNPLDYRSIQLGLRGNALYQYVNDWIVEIEDITEYVKKLDEKKRNGKDILEELPKEKIYHVEKR